MIESLATALAGRQVGILAAVLATTAAFLLPTPRGRALAALAALASVPALILSEIWSSDQLAALRDRPLLVVAALALAFAASGALAAAMLRRPEALALLAVLALPFRIPLEAGGETALLLVPLYLVVGAGVLAYGWARLSPWRQGEPVFAVEERRPRMLELALLGFLALYALQTLYSTDVDAALKNIAFFYIPFALLLRMLCVLRWSGRLALQCLAVAVVLAFVFVSVGFWEYATQQVLWNPKVMASNEIKPYFRVNSLFFDPNVYGRFLAMVMAGLAGALLWSGTKRSFGLAIGALAVLLAGLLLTFSQSSLTALMVALTVLAVLRWRFRSVAIAAGALLIAGVAVVVAAPGLVNLDAASKRSLDSATSGRANLVSGGVRMFADRPVFGFGSGSFAERFRAREGMRDELTAAESHTIPITVAAEQGLLGLAAYALLLVVTLRLLLGGLRPLRGPPPQPLALVAAGVLAAQSCALLVHTLLYAAFLEDPTTWTLLAVAVGLRVSGEVGSPAAQAPGASGLRPGDHGGASGSAAASAPPSLAIVPADGDGLASRVRADRPGP